MNGRAAAPPAMGCIMGVSTSMKPCASMKRRKDGSLRAFEEDFAHFGIHDQVDVALAIARSTSSRPCHFSGKRQQVFDRKVISLDVHGEFAGARAEQIASTPMIADVEQLVQLEPLFADGIFLT